MDSKRAPLRQHFNEQERQRKLDKQFAERTAHLKALETTLINTYTKLIKFLLSKNFDVTVTNQLGSIKTPDVAQVKTAIDSLRADLKAKKEDFSPIVTVLGKMSEELAKIPKELPKFDQKDEISVKNLSDIVFDTTGLEDVIRTEIKKLDKKPVAPVVNVKEPDLKPLQGLFQGILDAIVANKPEKAPGALKIANLDDIKPTDTSGIEKKIEESNKHLKKLVEKPSGGGGGGSTPYTNAAGQPRNQVLWKSFGTDGGELPDSDGSNYYFGSHDGSGNYKIERMNKTTGISDFATGEVEMTQEALETLWSTRTELTYGILT